MISFKMSKNHLRNLFYGDKIFEWIGPLLGEIYILHGT